MAMATALHGQATAIRYKARQKELAIVQQIEGIGGNRRAEQTGGASRQNLPTSMSLCRLLD